MVLYDDYEQVAIANLPDFTPGSHKNYGLGIQFLQHAERSRGLIYLLDGTDSPIQQYETLSQILRQYNPASEHRRKCVVVNKIDLPEAKREYELLKRKLDAIGVSAKTGINLCEVLRIYITCSFKSRPDVALYCHGQA